MPTNWSREPISVATGWISAYGTTGLTWSEASEATWLTASPDSNWLTGVKTSDTTNPWTREV